jgi:hypothetical protein
MQGYDADNPNIELLRLRNFTIGKKISDDEVTSAHGLDTIVDLIGTMTPFVSSNAKPGQVCTPSPLTWVLEAQPFAPHHPCQSLACNRH